MGIIMSFREIDRLKILDSIVKGIISQREASKIMKLTPRHVRRILKKYKQYGAMGIVHKSRGGLGNMVAQKCYTQIRGRFLEVNHSKDGKVHYTQFRRMLQELDIDIIYAHSPQAKGGRILHKRST